MLKLIAGMLGVGLDDLAQREAQRRQRRLYAITAASVAGMLVASGLAYTAFDARDEARDQRREAEGLIGFMLGDLRAKLDKLEVADCPFTPRPTGVVGKRSHWVKPMLVGEVAFTEWTTDGKARHPSFQGLRKDKRPRDVVREAGPNG